MANGNGTRIRFAVLARVSTDKQEKKGESLRTQSGDLERSVEQLSGRIVERYGGQEHATPGHEKKEIDRLLRDAKLKKFDAVMVAHADRWSRDNIKSQAGLEELKRHGIRFFVCTMEYDLFNPEHSFVLAMSAVIGQFQASNQNNKSIRNRIARAKRGIPTVGKLPFGRVWDREKGGFSIDPKKKEMIAEVAERYLAGESLAMLAKEKEINHSYLHKTLTRRCGTAWDVTFHSDQFAIHETVTMTIPPLLDDATIKRIKQRALANKTYLHGKPKYKYLFSGMVFCGHCGYTMFGQMNQNGHRYYRHAHTNRGRNCTCQPRPWVRADQLEESVLSRLYEWFGNPTAIRRAIEDATPNREKVDAARKRLTAIDEKRKEIGQSKRKILRRISDGLVSDDEADNELARLKVRDETLQAESDRLISNLEHIPSPERIEKVADELFEKSQHADAWLAAKCRIAERGRYEGEIPAYMTWDDKRALASQIFSSMTPDGKPTGIYIFSIDGQQSHRWKKWRYALHGVTPPAEWMSNKGVVQCARHCRAPCPP